MADDGGLHELLETDGTIPGTDIGILSLDGEYGPSAQLARVLFAAIAGVVTQITTGIAQIPANFATGIVRALEGLLAILLGPDLAFSDPGESPVDGVFEVLTNSYREYAVGMWQQPIEQYGLLGLPVAIGITLLVVWITSVGYQETVRVLWGGR